MIYEPMIQNTDNPNNSNRWYEWKPVLHEDAFGRPTKPYVGRYGIVCWNGETIRSGKAVVHYENLDGSISVNRHYAKLTDLVEIKLSR